MITVTTHEAKTHFSKLLKKVSEGQEVTIKRGNTPVARIVPIQRQTMRKRPQAGEKTSEKIILKKDAFDPLSDKELKEWGL